MVSLKIYADRGPEKTGPIIARVADENWGLEVSLGDLKTGRTIPLSDVPWLVQSPDLSRIRHKLLHLDYVTILGARVHEQTVHMRMANEMRAARVLGIKKTVMHYSDALPVSEVNPQHMAAGVSLINLISAEEGVTTHLENTEFADAKTSVDFHYHLMEGALEGRHGNIGFCFDIGHAKALSEDPLEKWLGLLDDLQAANVPLHFHLHNNNGMKDQHLSFRQAEEQGLNAGDTFTGHQPYAEVFKTITNRYGGMKVLEVKPEEAEIQANWLQEQGWLNQKDRNVPEQSR